MEMIEKIKEMCRKYDAYQSEWTSAVNDVYIILTNNMVK